MYVSDVHADSLSKFWQNTTTEHNYYSQQFSDELAVASDEMNLGLPALIDPNTRLNKTSVEGGAFVFHYTLIKFSLDDINTQLFAATMGPELHNSVCLSEEMQMLLNMDVPLIYTYTGHEGKDIASIMINQSSCNRYKENLALVNS